MLSEEIIFKIWNSHPDALTSDEGVVSLSRAIEAAVQAEKQEPVKDEPVAWMSASGKSFVYNAAVGDSVPNWTDYYTIPLYARPQPDLTAEVERLREDSELLGNLLAVMHRDGGHHAFAVGNDQAMQDAMQVYYQQVERIAELEKLLGDASYETRHGGREMIFVFGSNLAGRHGKGAALCARNSHGAEYGVGVGMTGNAYAIPTKDERIRTLPLERIAKYVAEFLDYARAHPELEFEVTKIGCGLAGYREHEIKPMFAGAPTNCHLPDWWRSN